MDLFAIGVTLLAVMLVVLVIRSLFTKSRDTHNVYHDPYDASSHVGYTGHPGEPAASSPQHGDWGGRDMSQDHHSHVDSDGSSDWGGGDAGGGDSGGGGGE